MAAKLPGVLAAVVIAAPALASTDTGYRTVQSVELAGGSFQILEDERLTPTLARKLWRTAIDPVFVLGEDNPAAQPFKARPLRPAKLRQMDRAGTVVLDLVLDDEAPLAQIETRKLQLTSGPIYLVTTDDDAGFGSYSGHATALYAVQGGRIAPVRATGAGEKPENIILADTLKSGWKIIDSSPAHTVIEQLLCRPDLEHEKPSQEEPFLLSYITYQFDGHAWRVAKSVKSGFWESDQAWPSVAEFPRTGTE